MDKQARLTVTNRSCSDVASLQLGQVLVVKINALPGSSPFAGVFCNGAVYEGPHITLPPPGDVEREHS